MDSGKLLGELVVFVEGRNWKGARSTLESLLQRSLDAIFRFLLRYSLRSIEAVDLASISFIFVGLAMSASRHLHTFYNCHVAPHILSDTHTHTHTHMKSISFCGQELCHKG